MCTSERKLCGPKSLKYLKERRLDTHEAVAQSYNKSGVWDKVWVIPQGCVVKVFPTEVSKDTQSVP